jgi:predicted N-acyltransferase
MNFSSFEEYLKTLSYISRSGLRRKFRKIDGKVKIDLEITNRLDGSVLDEAYALYMQTFERQGVGLEKVPLDFFKNISKNIPEETKFFLWRIDNRIVAFTFCLISGGQFIDYYLGLDYSVAHQYSLYFVRFRDLMSWCIENKIKRYEFGPTGYESKRRLGFKFIPLYNYVKHHNRFLNPAFEVLSRLLVRKLYRFFSE